MDSRKIRFGTDGWRGIISDDFTMERVRIVSQGVAEYLKGKTNKKSPLVVIGYDSRFMSDRFAAAAADIFSLNGIEVILAREMTPTPTVSTAVVKAGADLGIMITASHNPYYYNGYKIKGPFGGSATMDMVGEIEAYVKTVDRDPRDHETLSGNRSFRPGNITTDDLAGEYIEHALGQVDEDIIKGFGFGLLFEPMYGATQDIFNRILSRLGPGGVTLVHSEVNPGFGNINPEPIGDNLDEAVRVMKETGCSLGICLDGDGDRIGALGDGGNYISSHHIFAMVLRDLAVRRGLNGKVIKTVTTSSVIDRICAVNGLEMETTPVGFKYIGEKILEGGVIMGGEESGGLWSYGNIPERDGMIMGLRLLELICREKKTANQILDDIYSEYGFFDYQRTDYKIDANKKKKLIKKLGSGIPGILKNAGVREVITIDGYKYPLDEYNWVMIRPSGTESVVRIYSEGDSIESSRRLQDMGRTIMDEL
jgi:phosphomannomutase